MQDIRKLEERGMLDKGVSDELQKEIRDHKTDKEILQAMMEKINAQKSSQEGRHLERQKAAQGVKLKPSERARMGLLQR